MLRDFRKEFSIKDVRIKLRNSEHIATLLIGRFGVGDTAYVQGIGYVPVEVKKNIFGRYKVTNLGEIQAHADAVSKAQDVETHLFGLNTLQQYKEIDLGNDTLTYFATLDETGKPGEARIDTTYNLDKEAIKGLDISYHGLFVGDFMLPRWTDYEAGKPTRSFEFSRSKNDVHFYCKGTVAVPEQYRKEHSKYDARRFPVIDASIHVTSPMLHISRKTSQEEFEQTMTDAANLCRTETADFFNIGFFITHSHKRRKETKKEQAEKEYAKKKEMGYKPKKTRRGYKTVRRG